jgi:hypothetical protein
MKEAFKLLALLSAFASIVPTSCEGVERFVSPLGRHLPPFTDWATAATNIQDAIDASAALDLIWVTNGIYSVGGRAVGGSLTNRVTLDRRLTVQSVNGPEVTIVQGTWDPATNGPLAVRCLWITNGAALRGFTLRGGATSAFTASPTVHQAGGGVYGASTNALVTDSLLIGNAAGDKGGGAYGVTLSNCTVSGNVALGPASGTSGYSGSGGGASDAVLLNCRLTGNRAGYAGGGAYRSTLRNCAVVSNRSVYSGAGLATCKALNTTVSQNLVGNAIYGYGGGAYDSSLTNCVLYQNLTSLGAASSNYSSCTMAWCCSAPLPPGAGNISSDPQLLSDGVHLAAASLCRGQGNAAFMAGSDIDGQAWANPPAMGCDEWHPAPVISSRPEAEAGGAPPRLRLISGPVAGQEPFAYSWVKDGVPLEDDGHFSSAQSSSLQVTPMGPVDAGTYQIIASNFWGMTTSSIARVSVKCVDAGSAAPAPPYSGWDSAASMIQDALDAADTADFILVTNGIYNAGGRAMFSDLTNRVALTKPITVLSMNGPASTVIEGGWDPVANNGPLAVRCAWLTNGASLHGFTLWRGATRQSGNQDALRNGGGVFGCSTNAIVTDCVLAGNTAYYLGGGCFMATLKSSVLYSNAAQMGGGAHSSLLIGCALYGNYAWSYGGAGHSCTLIHCTAVENLALSTPGLLSCAAYNSIVCWNMTSSGSSQNYLSTTFTNCCTTPLPPGAGNLSADPELTDSMHLAITSPCRNTGSLAYPGPEHDVDNEPWANPPSIGCDEFWEAGITGPLTVGLFVNMQSAQTVLLGHNVFFTGVIVGRASRLAWDFGDGASVTNRSLRGTSHSWTNTGVFPVTFTAFNADHPEGVSTNLNITVLPLDQPTLAVGGLAGANFTVDFSSQAGVSYYLEQTANLSPPVLWQSVQTAVGMGGPLRMTDTHATNEMRFYRLRAQ